MQESELLKLQPSHEQIMSWVKSKELEIVEYSISKHVNGENFLIYLTDRHKISFLIGRKDFVEILCQPTYFWHAFDLMLSDCVFTLKTGEEFRVSKIGQLETFQKNQWLPVPDNWYKRLGFMKLSLKLSKN